MGVLQLGFITIFLSEPLLSGYTTGAAMHVFSRQLQHITGLGEIIRVPQGHLMIPKVMKCNEHMCRSRVVSEVFWKFVW